MADEKNFENRVKRWLDAHCVWYVKFFANRNTRSGVPDILACVGGKFVGIELKGPRGQPSALQLYNCREIASSGGIAVVAWPEDFEQLKRLIVALQEEGDEADVSNIVFPRGHVYTMPDEVCAALHRSIRDAV